jgi:hypothetical protein
MANNGLELVGSRPPSRLDSRVPSSSRSSRYLLSDRQYAPGLRSESVQNISSYDQSVGGNYEYQNKSPFGATQTLYSSNRPREDFMTRTYTKGRPPMGHTKNADVMLSDRPISRQQSARSIMSDRPPSGYRASHPSQGRSSRRPSRLRMASYVDETLFGSVPQETNFPAPWAASDVNRNNSTSSRPSSARPPSSRKPRPSQPSFVDDSLFGNQLEQASWRAPWEKPESNRRPLLFDSHDYRLTVEHDINTVKENKGRTTNLARTNSLGNLGIKPPWR